MPLSAWLYPDPLGSDYYRSIGRDEKEYGGVGERREWKRKRTG